MSGWNPELIEWATKHNVKLPRANSIKATLLQEMTSEESLSSGKWWDRKDMEAALKKHNKWSNDVIQPINKTEQWGLKNPTKDGRNRYRFEYPFIYVATHVEKRKVQKVNPEDKKKQIELIKENIKKDYIDVPIDKWQLGHRNPDLPDGTPDNLVWQPPIQGKFRDRFVFDPLGLMKYPTPKEIARNPSAYYSEGQLKELYAFLSKRFRANS
jgi:hypothetical protein